MPTYTYPGVYIEEIPSAVHTITGVATSIAAFAGWAAKGPVNAATLVQSWSDYENQFGGLDSRSYLGYALNQFFANGGQQAYIVRLVSTANPGAPGSAVAANTTIAIGPASIKFASKAPGAWGNAYAVQISAPTNGIAADFKLSVVYAPQGTVVTTVETFDNLAVGGVAAIVSNYIAVTVTGAPAGPPALGTYPLSGGVDGDGVNVPAAGSASVSISGLTFNSTAATSTVTITTGSPGLTISALNPGAWGNTLSVQIQPRADDYTRFTLSVIATNVNTLASGIVENFTNLSLNAHDPAGRYIVNVLNEQSGYLSATMSVATPLTLTNTPGIPASPKPAGTATSVLSGGNDGALLAPSIPPSSAGAFETALTAALPMLAHVPIFNLLAVPGEVDPATIAALQKFAVDNKAFYIVDSKQADTYTSLLSGPDTAIVGNNAINSAFYFPWPNVFDPLLKVTRAFPPSGFVAGLYAATDSSRGVWKAPAGINASLTGQSGLSTILNDAQNGSLNPQAINCLRHFPVYGDVVWGARTLRGNDQVGSDWKYVPIRRLALFLEASLYQGTQWVVFEPNDEPLWSQIRLNVGSFMQGLFQQGAFQGTTPTQAYFVKCDAENNPPSSVAQGIVKITVGFAPLYPAEFVVIQIAQIAGQTQ